MDKVSAKPIDAYLSVFKTRGDMAVRAKAAEPPVGQSAQLPLWPEASRCLPNELLRSALFNAKNRKQPRAYLKKQDIPVLFPGRITYQGEELRQDDETVWLQLIHLARDQPLGSMVEFTPYGFCKAVGWPICKGGYERLRDCLNRMQATSLTIYSKRLKDADPDADGVALSMIPLFAWQDENEQTLKKYRVRVAPELVALFANDHYTRVEWKQRLALPVGIATWLHGYYATHRVPNEVKMDTIKKGAGITTERQAKVRELIGTALAELVNVGFLASWDISERGLVSVKRAT